MPSDTIGTESALNATFTSALGVALGVPSGFSRVYRCQSWLSGAPEA